jgi:hypothetical protein
MGVGNLKEIMRTGVQAGRPAIPKTRSIAKAAMITAAAGLMVALLFRYDPGDLFFPAKGIKQVLGVACPVPAGELSWLFRVSISVACASAIVAAWVFAIFPRAPQRLRVALSGIGFISSLIVPFYVGGCCAFAKITSSSSYYSGSYEYLSIALMILFIAAILAYFVFYFWLACLLFAKISLGGVLVMCALSLFSLILFELWAFFGQVVVVAIAILWLIRRLRLVLVV